MVTRSGTHEIFWHFGHLGAPLVYVWNHVLCLMTILLLDLIVATLINMPERPFYHGYSRALQDRLRILLSATSLTTRGKQAVIYPRWIEKVTGTDTESILDGWEASY